ncbi:MAG: T9SS type A sorting domain-containing protein [Ignavibacteriales bacterium]|nr:T9SS type A sorting domain-containing protein [Ignavibacteriales bacterium]
MNCDTVLQKINSAFEGRMDTVRFADTLRLKGTRTLGAVPFLHRNSTIAPARITPVEVTVTEENEILETPQAFALSQNYPNPFNPTTTIEFDVPGTSTVTLKVYNIIGQEIVTLLDHEIVDEGREVVEFNAAELASGVYFYRIVAEPLNGEDEESSHQPFVAIKKMMLLK